MLRVVTDKQEQQDLSSLGQDVVTSLLHSVSMKATWCSAALSEIHKCKFGCYPDGNGESLCAYS